MLKNKKRVHAIYVVWLKTIIVLYVKYMKNCSNCTCELARTNPQLQSYYVEDYTWNFYCHVIETCVQLLV